ncbi:MAG: hypothetical protein PUJ80_11510 [Verrucomicrobiota bacterium]|nr:hypothetical protein [Verrucomicrobiota bacterium]
MASEKIQLTFSGKYDAAAAFKEANQDVKNWQASNRDAADSVKKGFAQIAGTISGDLGGSIRAVIPLMEQLFAGGASGAVGAVVTAGLRLMISWYQNLREEAEAHVKQIQDMATGYRKLIEAQLAAKAAAEQDGLEATVKRAEDACKALDALTSAYNSLAAASDAAIGNGGNLKIAQINDEFSQRLAEACDELKPLVTAERNLALAVQRQETSREQQTRAIENEKVALAGIEKRIEMQKDAIAKMVDAGIDTAAAEAKLSTLRAELATQTQRLKNAETVAATAALQHETAVRDATVALESAKGAWDRTVAANEAEMEAAADKAYMDAQMAKITRVCAVNQLEANSYISLFKDSLAKGLTETEAYAELQKKLNEELEKRSKAEKDSITNSTKDGKKTRESAEMRVSINPSQVGQGVAEWDGKTTWHNTREQMSQDVRDAAQERKRMNQELAPYINLLKGNYPEAMAKAYMDRLMQDYSMTQLQEMTEKALGRQLLSTSEQKEQLETLKKMLTAMEQQGLK